MKMNKITSVEEALQLFEDITIKRGSALDADDFKTYNKQFSQVHKCIMYLYEQQQIHLLRIYFKHNNQHVRYSAASALLPLYEKESTKILSDIASGNYGLLSLNAKTTLMMWRDGELKFPYQTNSGKKSVSQKEDKHSIEVSNKNEEHLKDEDFSPETLWLSQIFECPPTGDNDLRNEQAEFYVSFEPTKQEIEIRVNTFVNPYTQDVETVYQERLERFKAFENVATIEANEPSKLGFMQIVLTIPKEKTTNEVLTQLKNTIYSIYNEWKQNESLVWFKVKYHKGISYFEGSWWYPLRAIIKNRRGYERYDFSDELKFDEDMWEIVQGEYDEFENSDSFALIDGKDFQEMWETTELNYNPKPY
jgi:hypothetical protein